MISRDSLLLLLLSVFCIAGAIFEFPILFDGKFRTYWIISKIGKKKCKLLLIAIGLIFLALAVILR